MAGTNGARHEIPIENLNQWQEVHKQRASLLNDKAFLHLDHLWLLLRETIAKWKQ